MNCLTQHFNQTLLLLGEVQTVKPEARIFDLKLRTGEIVPVFVGTETVYSVLANLDKVDYDRVPDTDAYQDDPTLKKLTKYVKEGEHLYVNGIRSAYNGMVRFDAIKIQLLHYEPQQFLFEQNTHWWLSQIKVMGDDWLLDLFGDRYVYSEDDFVSSYRTSLNLYGGQTDDNTQYMQSLSRLIFGLSSAYLLLGDRRFLDAAASGVAFQRSSFRITSHDGKTVNWCHSRRRTVDGAWTVVPSTASDDADAIPIYEQIYALAGLTQYYRITGDCEVLEDIIRTVRMFNRFFRDTQENGYAGFEGYFAWIDPSTMRADRCVHPQHRLRKNWNSIGDHIPAYLVNLILALDPLPLESSRELGDFLKICQELLDRVTNLIIEKFPDPDTNIPYVNERFHADWTPDRQWSWQQNRAIVGHNLKIAWNLTRVANYYNSVGRQADAARAMRLAERLGKGMIDSGLDLIRGGCFDAVERQPSNGQSLQLVWGSHKDFWQQEQGILAYLILYGYTKDPVYLEYYRDIASWWNSFQLDRENRSIFFRVNDVGVPLVNEYGKSGYQIAGYHSYELCYLAHIYLRTYVNRTEDSSTSFCLYFRPSKDNCMGSINVLPDFLGADSVEVSGICINGKDVDYIDHNNFQIPLAKEDWGRELIVKFRSKKTSQ
jgi:mannose/cellobiose epimerase-like protein (N-acyl-D-glucosamine 2-epimerase family)